MLFWIFTVTLSAVIWDRDYMKRQDDQSKVADAASSNSENPTPFNLFAGLEPEPLKPGETIQPKNPPLTQNTPSQSDAIRTTPSSNPKLWIYVIIALAALIIGIAIGSEFLRRPAFGN